MKLINYSVSGVLVVVMIGLALVLGYQSYKNLFLFSGHQPLSMIDFWSERLVDVSTDIYRFVIKYPFEVIVGFFFASLIFDGVRYRVTKLLKMD